MESLFAILGQPSGGLITFGVSRTTDGTSVVQLFPGGATMAIAAGEQLVVLGGTLSISGAAGTIRVENQAATALGPTITVSGNGQYKAHDLPPMILSDGDELAITTGGSGAGTIYGFGYIRPVNG